MDNNINNLTYSGQVSSNRLTHIDVLKGIGILCVILGHCAITHPIDIKGNDFCHLVQLIIYSFHMPLFFFLSGYTFSVKRRYSEFISKRVVRLLVPFLFGTTILLAEKIIFEKYTESKNTLLGHFVDMFIYAKTLWFLMALFICNVSLYPLVKRQSNHLVFAISVFMFVISFLVKEQALPFCIDKVLYYQFFLMLGYWFRRFEDHKILVEYLPALSIVYIISLFSIIDTNKYWGGYEILSPFTGTLVLYIFVKCLLKSKAVSSILLHFGKYSLQYYLYSMFVGVACGYVVFFINKHIIMPAPLNAVLIFLITILVSAVMLIVTKRIRFIYFFVGL